MTIEDADDPLAGSRPSRADSRTTPPSRSRVGLPTILALAVGCGVLWWIVHTVSSNTHGTNAAIESFERHLHAWRVVPAGTEGYAKAEVTVGGVSTDELDAGSMESKKVAGLYFIGEVVDVTGWLGGYNFQWAWASGAAAGRSV